MENEIIWNTIPSFSSYEVSSDGQVRESHTGHLIPQHKRPNYVSCEHGKGYLSVKLRDDKNRLRNKYVHSLVAVCFLERDPEDTRRLFVTHINDDVDDNRSSNLRLVSGAEKSLRAVKMSQGSRPYTSRYKGVSRSGDGRFRARVTDPDGRQVQLGTFACEKEAAKAYDDRMRVYHDVYRLNWSSNESALLSTRLSRAGEAMA